MPFIVPRALTDVYGTVSGKLPAEAMEECGTPGWVMWGPAARCHRALMAAARAAGFDPRSTGTYRSYERQVALFRERYSPAGQYGGCKTWQGVRWCKHLVNGKVPADAAVPGTSEHGWGCADDIAEEFDGDVQPEAISNDFFVWLVLHARVYGFENTNRSERWHWAYVLGGEIPPAVIAYENPPIEEVDDVRYIYIGADGRPGAIFALDGSGASFVGAASPEDAQKLIDAYGAPLVPVSVAQYDEMVRVAREG